MASNITISFSAPTRSVTPPSQKASPASTPPQTPPQREKVIVKPRFMGDNFVYVPQKVSQPEPGAVQGQSPKDRFLDWLCGPA